MAIDNERIAAAIAKIAEIDGLFMSPEALVEDVVLLAVAWPDEEDFDAAVANTLRALRHVCAGRVTPSKLEGILEGWYSYHYQLHCVRGMPSHLRIVYRSIEAGVEVMGFGHRFKPTDIYRRLVRGER